MEMSNKKLLAALGVALVEGLALGRFTLPAKVVTKVEYKTEIKEVIKWKTQYAKQEDKNKDIVIIETKYPDGRVVREKHITDKGVIHIDKKEDGSKETDTKTDKKEETVTTYSKNDWHFMGMTSPSAVDKPFGGTLSYGLMIEKRIIGPFYLGGFGLTNGVLGVGVGIGF